MKKILVIILLIFPFNIFAINDSSHSSIVMDIDSGRILYQHDSNTERLIASTTKLMTFLVAITYASDKLDSKVIVGDEILKMYGTNMYLSLKEELTLRDLLYGLMLRSGNDASVVISKYVAGNIDDFVSLMNIKAKEIGMNNTIFKNPHGLDEETKNYSTAYDLAILIKYLSLNYPIYKEIAGSKYYNFKSNIKSYTLTNRSKIIFTYKNIITAKNGYTPSAGKCLATTASFNNLNLVIVTLDDFDTYKNHQNLYEYYFDKYQNYLLIDKNNFQIPSLDNHKYYIKNSFKYPLTIDEKSNIEKKVIIENKKNQVGKINIYLDNKLIHEENIYLKEEKKQINFFEKIIKKIKNKFSK